jgi:hypothetical protein
VLEAKKDVQEVKKRQNQINTEYCSIFNRLFFIYSPFLDIRIIGLATKIDEYVPIRTPTIIANVKL